VKVLVTGGAGFIGSYVVKRLIKLGYDVRVLDNFSRGKRDNLADVLGQIDLISGDIRDQEAVKKSIKGIDVVIHMAALVDVRESVEKPLLYHEVNSTGTLNLLYGSVKQGVKRFIYASTCAVYGNPVKLPISEDHPLNPLSPYAASKLSAENYCRAFSKSYGLKTTIFRFFNVYGPRKNINSYSGVIIEFIKRIKSDKPPIIFGSGEQTRDFIFIDDAVEFVIRSVENDIEGVFNVGSGESTSINNLSELLLKIMRKEHLKPIHTSPRPGEIKNSQADISKACKVFNYRPRVSLEEGLRRVINAVN